MRIMWNSIGLRNHTIHETMLPVLAPANLAAAGCLEAAQIWCPGVLRARWHSPAWDGVTQERRLAPRMRPLNICKQLGKVEHASSTAFKAAVQLPKLQGNVCTN